MVHSKILTTVGRLDFNIFTSCMSNNCIDLEIHTVHMDLHNLGIFLVEKQIKLQVTTVVVVDRK